VINVLKGIASMTIDGKKYAFGDGSISTAAPAPTSATVSLTPTPESLATLAKWVADFEEADARRFNEVIKAQGFDLDKGDMLIVPKGSTPLHVPARYRHLVHESALADRAMLMRDPTALSL
jgi:hypothetical protein